MAPPIAPKAVRTGYELSIPPRSHVKLITDSPTRVEFLNDTKKVLFERVDNNVGIDESRQIDDTLSLSLDYSERAGQTELAATFRFRLSLTAAQLEALGFGLRYSWFADQNNLIARLQDFTILRPWDPSGSLDAKLILDAVVDPFNHRERDRTRFAIPRSVRLSRPRRDLLQVLKTTVPTTHGVDLLLVPQKHGPAPRFVFIKHTTLAKADGLPEFGGTLELDSLSANLAPDGVFELQEASLDDANGRVPLARRDNFGLLTGMSDREFIRLDKDDQIEFRPDGPAYDPNWALEESGSAGPLRPAKLYADPLGQTTSWVSVIGPGPDRMETTTLVSESTDLALYQPDGGDPVALKGHYRPIGLQVTHRSVPLKGALPIVPYHGLPPHPTTAFIKHFEKRTVVPYRR
jgi:hypothetical protein